MSAAGSIFNALFFLLALSSCLEAKELPEQIKQTIAPYLLPSDHPVKPFLDALFGSSRVIFNLETLEKAGFKKSSPRKFSKLIVTRHSALPGYIFKLYLDTQRYHKEQGEYVSWILRVQGCEQVRNTIAQLGLEAFFKVPKKWIYILPKYPEPKSSYYPKYTVLVEEDMFLVSKKENEALWASSFVTESLLNDVYLILKKVGLYDCAKPDNIPFSQDGKIAFIDTETFGRSTVCYENLCSFLSESNRMYWESLTGCKE